MFVIVCNLNNFPYVYGPYASIKDAMEARKGIEEKWNDKYGDRFNLYIKEVNQF